MTQLCRSAGQLLGRSRVFDSQASAYRHYCSSCCGCKSLYDTRKYSHGLPCLNSCSFEGTGILRDTCNEILGPGAHECSYYKVPEYFSYHNMSFYDFHLWLRCWRMPSPDTKRKP